MTKFKSIIVALILAIVLLAAEVVIIRSATEYEPQTAMVFAGCKISEGTLITAEMLNLKMSVASSLHKYSLQDKALALGKIASTDIEQGEMILSTRLTDVKKQDIEIMLGEAGRLIAVELEAERADAWQLSTGSYVDIIFIPSKQTLQPTIEADASDVFDPEHVFRFENIRIAALVDSEGGLIKGGDAEASEKKERRLPRYILFEVPLGTDIELALAEASGKLEVSSKMQ